MNMTWSPGVLPVRQLGLEEGVLGMVEGGHVPLHPIEDVFVAFPAGGGRDCVDVGSCPFLRDGVALLLLSSDPGHHVLFNLLGCGHRREP